MIAEFHESRCLLTAERVDSTSAYGAIASEHAYGFPRQSSEAGHDAASPWRAHFPERRVLRACGPLSLEDVDDERDEAPDVVGARAALWDDGRKLLLATIVFVSGGFDRGKVEDGGGKVGEESPDLVEGVVFGCRDVVYCAVGRVDINAA